MVSTIESHDSSKIIREWAGTQVPYCYGRAHVAVAEVKNDHIRPVAFEAVNGACVGAKLLIEIYFQVGVRQIFEQAFGMVVCKDRDRLACRVNGTHCPCKGMHDLLSRRGNSD